jgi:uncharacterized membrane protein
MISPYGTFFMNIGIILAFFGILFYYINLIKPFKNKAVYDLAGGIIYYVGLFAVAIYFKL